MDWQRFTPGFWMQNYPTDEAWDEALNVALDTHGITSVGYATATVGPFKVWVANYPYAFGRMDGHGCLPKVATRKRLKRMIGDKLIEKARSFQ